MATDLIVLARQFGAGGSEVASILGRTLGWRVLDRELLHAAATLLHAEERHIAAIDEHAASALERIVSTFTLGAPEAVLDPVYEVDPDAVAAAVHQIVRAAAKSPPAVVVGHGAQCIFHGRPGTLHVRVVASVEARAERVARRESLPLEDARDEVVRRDRQRERYLRRHFACEPADPALYALQVNTARMTVGQCVAAIVAVVRAETRFIEPDVTPRDVVH